MPVCTFFAWVQFTEATGLISDSRGGLGSGLGIDRKPTG